MTVMSMVAVRTEAAMSSDGICNQLDAVQVPFDHHLAGFSSGMVGRNLSQDCMFGLRSCTGHRTITTLCGVEVPGKLLREIGDVRIKTPLSDGSHERSVNRFGATSSLDMQTGYEGQWHAQTMAAEEWNGWFSPDAGLGLTGLFHECCNFEPLCEFVCCRISGNEMGANANHNKRCTEHGSHPTSRCLHDVRFGDRLVAPSKCDGRWFSGDLFFQSRCMVDDGHVIGDRPN